MSENDLLCPPHVPVMVTIKVPEASFQGAPFVYSTKTYVPGIMSLCEAESMLECSVRNGAIAFFMENMGYDEERAMQAIKPGAVTVEWANA